MDYKNWSTVYTLNKRCKIESDKRCETSTASKVTLPGLDAHNVSVGRLGIELCYRGPYIHVGDHMTKLLYITKKGKSIYSYRLDN